MRRYLLDSNTRPGDERSDLDEFGSGCLTILESLPIAYDDDILADTPYLLMRCIGGIGNFCEWADRATVCALLEDATRVTRRHFEAVAWSNSKLVKMTREVMVGEEMLKDGSEEDLANLYGLESIRGVSAEKLPESAAGLRPDSEADTKADTKVVATSRRPGGRRVGQRGPSRDPVGDAA